MKVLDKLFNKKKVNLMDLEEYKIINIGNIKFEKVSEDDEGAIILAERLNKKIIYKLLFDNECRYYSEEYVENLLKEDFLRVNYCTKINKQEE